MPNSRAASGVTWSCVRASLELEAVDAGTNFCVESSGLKAAVLAGSEEFGTKRPL